MAQSIDLPSFEQLEKDQKVIMVPMDGVRACEFGASTTAIATQDLNGCLVVVIFSHRAAVLAHIAPGPGLQQARRDPDSMSAHVARMMRAVQEVYTAHVNLFPHPGSETHTVHAWFEGELGSPDQKELIAEHLRAMGLPDPTSHRYDAVLIQGGRKKPPRGTVVMHGTSPPRLLVEDQIVAGLDQVLVRSSRPAAVPSHAARGTPVTASASSSAVPTTSTPRSGMLAKYSGWVFVQNLYLLLDDGVVVQRQQQFPTDVTVFNAYGWHGSERRWARWDGNPAHAPEYR